MEWTWAHPKAQRLVKPWVHQMVPTLDLLLGLQWVLHLVTTWDLH